MCVFFKSIDPVPFSVSTLFVCLYLFCPQSGQHPSCFLLPLTPSFSSAWKCSFVICLQPPLFFYSTSFFISTFCYSILYASIFLTMYNFSLQNFFHNSILWNISNLFFCLFFCLQRIKFFFEYLHFLVFLIFS